MKRMLLPQDWVSARERLPQKSGYYFAVSDNDIFEISVIAKSNIALFIRDPEKFDKEVFQGIHEPKWFFKSDDGHMIEITSLISHWLPQRTAREIMSIYDAD